MQPSEEQQQRIIRMVNALDEKLISQSVANHMTVALLTEIAACLDRIEKRLESSSQQR